MREIKFRGKRCLGGAWIYGDLLHNVETGQVAVAQCHTENNFGEYDVIADTVGQFTGLFDKNGVEIYEGDIVTITGEDGTICGLEVRFVGAWLIENSSFQLELYDEELADYEITVVGNIHDNPEMREGGQR